LADQDAESENDEYLEEYNEYNLPDDDKVVDDARRRLKTRVTVSAKGAKKNSSPLPTSPSKSGKSTVRGKVTRPRRTTKSENRGTTRSSVSKHTLNAKVSKGATKNTPGTIDRHETNAANKIASAKFGSEAPISVTESIMGKARSIQASRFKEKELTTCRNNTDCLGGKYCMFVHDANLRVCVEAKDVMRIYKDAVAYPHVDFPYENLLSRENKYQHCEANPDCDRESDGLTLHCQNMACLGKICVEDPINGCLSGFDCPEQYNCVRPSCGSQLQTEFGICIPLAPMARFY